MNHWMRMAIGLSCLWLLVDRFSPTGFADDAADADTLQQQANELFRAGQFQLVIPLQQRILELREKTVGPEHLLVALSCQNLSFLCLKTRDFEKSKSFRKRQLAILEKNLGSQHAAIAQALAELAEVNTEMGDYAEAERLYQRALEMFEKTTGIETPQGASWLLNQGELYDKMGNYSKAEPILLRALTVAEKTLGPENASTAVCAFKIAKIYRQHDEYAKAEILFTRTLAIFQKSSGTDQLQAPICISLYELHLATGNILKAASFAEQTLAIRERSLGPEHPDTVQSLQDLANVCVPLGESAKADALYRRAEEILERTLGPNHRNTLACRQMRANHYALMGDSEKALVLQQQVLNASEKTLGSEHDDTLCCAASLAAIYQGTGNYRMAEQLLHRALAGWSKKYSANAVGVIDGLASLYSRIGDPAKAGPLYEQALIAGEKVFGPEHPNVARYLNNLGHYYLLTGNDDKSEPLLRRALAIHEKAYGPGCIESAAALDDLAWYFLAKRKPEYALDPKKSAWRILGKRREQIFSFASERQQAAFAETLRNRIDENVSLAARELPNNPAARHFALSVVLSSKGAILESIAQRQANIARNGSPELKQLFDQYRSASSMLSKAMMTPAKPGHLMAHLARIAELEKQKEAAEEVLSRACAPFASECQSRRITVIDVARALPTGSALVEFVKYRPFQFDAKGAEQRRGDWNYVALVLRSGEKSDAPDVALVPLGPADKIEAAIKCWRKVFDVTLYKNPAVNLPVFEPASKDLASLVWNPIVPALGDSRKVYISPDGELAFVNFGALPGQNTGRYLIEDLDISYVTSGRDLIRSGLGQGNLPLLVGAPDYGTRSLFREAVFLPLPGTLAEVKTIASLLTQHGENPTILTGAQATEAAVKAAKRPRILHLATHGFFLPDVNWDWLTTRNGLLSSGGGGTDATDSARLWLQIKKDHPMRRSGVALAGANETFRGRREPGENDGILTAEEVIGMDLWGTQLVVISACESGLGESRGGEGVFGLRRAFALAGAQNLVMTLWPVADEPTMMGFLYRHLQTEGTPQRALLTAQREWIAKERSAGREPHPFFWAAFVASGTGFGLEKKSK